MLIFVLKATALPDITLPGLSINFLSMIIMDSVTSPTAWLNTFKAGDVKCTKYVHYNEAHTLCNMVSRYNSGRGKEKGLFFHAHKNVSEDFIVVVVVCEIRSEHFNNLHNGQKNAWKQKIPKTFD